MEKRNRKEWKRGKSKENIRQKGKDIGKMKRREREREEKKRERKRRGKEEEEGRRIEIKGEEKGKEKGRVYVSARAQGMTRARGGA